MARVRFYAIRPRKLHSFARIQKASNPKRAFYVAFNNAGPFPDGYQYKDLGPRGAQVDWKVINNPDGWFDFPNDRTSMV